MADDNEQFTPDYAALDGRLWVFDPERGGWWNVVDGEEVVYTDVDRLAEDHGPLGQWWTGDSRQYREFARAAESNAVYRLFPDEHVEMWLRDGRAILPTDLTFHDLQAAFLAGMVTEVSRG
jgi:hypothetical protein